MGTGYTTSPLGDERAEESTRGARAVLGLAVVWSASEAHRVGEIALLDGAPPWTIGRDDPDTSTTPFWRRAIVTGGLSHPTVSRRQLEIDVGDGLLVRRPGRATTLVDGVAVDAASALHDGALVDVGGRYLMLVVRRDLPLPSRADDRPFPFGGADAAGIVGESQRAWKLRADLAFVGAATPHVLVCGESGTGKELCARSIHDRSARARGPFIARNVATIPAALMAAELFGNLRNYPNAGMPERVGLVGEADGGTLFLDEIGEISSEMQAQLLRVLDSGEYHRLGESKSRRTSFRLVAATNRDESALKFDLAARLVLRVDVPPLRERREDIPLIARHLVLRAARDNEIARRFVVEDGRHTVVRFHAELMADLVSRDWSTNVRELERALWDSMAASPGGELRAVAAPPQRGESAELLALLEKHRWNVTQAAAATGRTRFALTRLMAKLGVKPPKK